MRLGLCEEALADGAWVRVRVRVRVRVGLCEEALADGALRMEVPPTVGRPSAW